MTASNAPISIYNDTSLAAFCAGNDDGTQSNPYVIQNYVIDATNANGIVIENTNVYLVIENCVLENTVEYGECSYHGIKLVNCSNIDISNNFINSNDYGIYLGASSNNTLTNNTFEKNNVGIYLSNSNNNNLLIYNTLFSNADEGIVLYNSNNNTLNNNIASANYGDGIDLDNSILQHFDQKQCICE